MSAKQFILFIVEGENDKKEIETILHTPYFDAFRARYQPEFKVIGNDITTLPTLPGQSSKKKSIKGMVTDAFQDWRNSGIPFHNIRTHEVHEIVQIVDLDGAFIPSTQIVKADTGKLAYTDTSIEAAVPSDVVHRNRVKSESLKDLINTTTIDNVPYSVYFVSCNMDHVLFNQRNSSRVEKGSNANKFRLCCKRDYTILLQSLFCEGIRADSNYSESWSDIQDGCSSLSRKTNFNLFFDERARTTK